MSAADKTSSFDKLLGELETMSKALPADGGDDADDKKIAAAADEGDDKGDDADKDKGGEGEQVAKSFTVTLEDGSKVEAQDGTELVKALVGRIDESEGKFQKALELAVTLIKAQGAQITKLEAEQKKLAGEGRGRKAVVSLVEKPDAGKTLAKSEDGAMTGEQFLAKAESAMKSGRITGGDLALAESCLNRGEKVPARIIERVVAPQQQ